MPEYFTRLPAFLKSADDPQPLQRFAREAIACVRDTDPGPLRAVALVQARVAVAAHPSHTPLRWLGDPSRPQVLLGVCGRCAAGASLYVGEDEARESISDALQAACLVPIGGAR